MKADIPAQTAGFFVFIGVGIFFSLLFALLMKTGKKDGFIIACIKDIVFCLFLLVCCTFLTLLLGGTFEGYMLLGLISGGVLFFLVFSDYFLK